MTRVVVLHCRESRPSDPWRWLVIAIGSLILCSCQALERTSQEPVDLVVSDQPALKRESALLLTSTAPPASTKVGRLKSTAPLAITSSKSVPAMV